MSDDRRVMRGVAGCALGLLLAVAAPSQGAAAVTVNVNCGAGQTIAGALASLGAGGIPATPPVLVRVRGTCTENVVLDSDRIELRGVGEAPTIAAADAEAATLTITEARRIVVRNLTIRGGLAGIRVERGSSAEIQNCTVRDNTGLGITTLINSITTVAGSTVRNNGGIGVGTSSNSTAAITDTVVRDNGGTGINAFQGAVVRVGQDITGSQTVRPVVVEDNGDAGITASDGSALLVVGGRVKGNAGTGINAARGSSARIGIGSGGLVGPVAVSDNGGTGINVFHASQAVVQGATIAGNTGNGVSITGGAAAVFGSTIRLNGIRGVVVSEGGTVKVGVTEANAAAGNLIEDNTNDGVGVFNGGFALLGANTIRRNRFGLSVGRATARLIGQNVIEQSDFDGIALDTGARLFQGQGDFTITPALDIVRDNARAGLNLFNNASAEIRSMSIIGNDVRGVVLGQQSSLFLTDSNVSNNTGDGVALFSGSVFQIASPGNASINGNTGFGINCVGDEASFGGDSSGVVGNTLGNVNCSGF